MKFCSAQAWSSPRLNFPPSSSVGDSPGLSARICLALLFAFPHFVENFVENLAEFDGLFSNMTRVDKVRDEVSDEERKVNNTLNTYFSPDCGTAIRISELRTSDFRSGRCHAPNIHLRIKKCGYSDS